MHRYLVPHIVHPVMRKFSFVRSAACIRQSDFLYRAQWDTPGEIQHRMSVRLRSLVTHEYENVDWYRTFSRIPGKCGQRACAILERGQCLGQEDQDRVSGIHTGTIISRTAFLRPLGLGDLCTPFRLGPPLPRKRGTVRRNPGARPRPRDPAGRTGLRVRDILIKCSRGCHQGDKSRQSRTHRSHGPFKQNAFFGKFIHGRRCIPEVTVTA